MKFKIFFLTLLLVPFVSSAQVYQNAYEAGKAAYEAISMKQCGKPSCIPDTEPDAVVIDADTIEVEEVDVPITHNTSTEKLEKENAQLKTKIALLQQIISLLKALAELKQ